MRTPTRRTVGLTATLVGIASMGIGFAAGPAAADDPLAANQVELKDTQQNTPQNAEGYDDSDCGDLDPADGPVWHFVMNNLADGSVLVDVVGDFGPSANVVTEQVSDIDSTRKDNGTGTQWQTYIQSTQPVLVTAVATFDRNQPTGQGGAQMVLSHICPGTVTTTTTTSTTAPTTTTTEATTTTTEATTTTTTEATTTTVAPTTTTTAEVLPTSIVRSPETTVAAEVLGVQVTRELPRTGNESGKQLAVSLGLILFGLGAVLLGQDRRGLAAERS